MKFLRAPWDRRKMQKIVANNFAFSQGGDVTASRRRLWRFYGVPAIAFPRSSSWRSTARSRRARGIQSALTASFNFIFKTAPRYLRKRHSSSDSGGVTHTFAIRFITASIDTRMGGKNKKLKAGKNRGN